MAGISQHVTFDRDRDEQQADQRTGNGTEGLTEAEPHCGRVSHGTASQIFGWTDELIQSVTCEQAQEAMPGCADQPGSPGKQPVLRSAVFQS